MNWESRMSGAPSVPDLTLAEARAIMDRAIERTRRFKLAGPFLAPEEPGCVCSSPRARGRGWVRGHPASKSGVVWCGRPMEDAPACAMIT